MLGTGFIAGFAALAGAMVVGASLIQYLFIAFMFYFLANKLKTQPEWLAWVTIAQWVLFPMMAGKHKAWTFILLVPILGVVFAYIWMWHIYEKRKYPGWWALVSLGGLIPLVGFLFYIAALVMYLLGVFKDK